jgi:transcriptional regulator with XRE-family HTH domain
MILLGYYFEFCNMNEIHIGEKIKNVLDSSDISVSDFARKINKSRGNVYSIFSRATIDTNLLLKISTVLEYDFFILFSFSSKNLIEKNAVLEGEIKMLKKLNQLMIEKYENA